MRVLDLFSGIGGLSLGLERAGMRTVAFCEAEPYCRAVLAKQWPGVKCYDDVRTLTAQRLLEDGFEVDAICGGFPCQDISQAGTGAGLSGKRSGLWSEFARLIGELRPSVVVVENVSRLLVKGLDQILCDLASLGYDAEWHCIPASAVGAPHIRDRVWIIAYPQHSDADSERPHRAPVNLERGLELCDQQDRDAGSVREDVADADAFRELQPKRREREQWGWAGNGGWWISEPDVGRVAYGIPSRVDRLRCLGNAVVPQIPQIIGEAIMVSRNQK